MRLSLFTILVYLAFFISPPLWLTLSQILIQSTPSSFSELLHTINLIQAIGPLSPANEETQRYVIHTRDPVPSSKRTHLPQSHDQHLQQLGPMKEKLSDSGLSGWEEPQRWEGPDKAANTQSQLPQRGKRIQTRSVRSLNAEKRKLSDQNRQLRIDNRHLQHDNWHLQHRLEACEAHIRDLLLQAHTNFLTTEDMTGNFTEPIILNGCQD